MTPKRLLNSIATEADLERARHQREWLMENCLNPDCPIGCPPEHADLGFPEVDCATFRLSEAERALLPIGGAHPDTWHQVEQPGELRLYEADGTAILARDPEEAARLRDEKSPAEAGPG